MRTIFSPSTVIRTPWRTNRDIGEDGGSEITGGGALNLILFSPCTIATVHQSA
jgi:hypothetical protein